VVFILFLVVGI